MTVNAVRVFVINNPQPGQIGQVLNSIGQGAATGGTHNPIPPQVAQAIAQLCGGQNPVQHGAMNNGATHARTSIPPINGDVAAGANPNGPLTVDQTVNVNAGLAGFGGLQAVHHATPTQRLDYNNAFNSARQATLEAAKNPDFSNDIGPNTNPPGMHDSRSLSLVASDAQSAQQFSKLPKSEQQNRLFAADFYLAGSDNALASLPVQPTLPPAVPATQAATYS